MIEQLIFSTISAGVTELDGRVYPIVAKQNETYPYATYMVVSGIDRVSKNKNRAIMAQEYRIQVDIYAKTALEVKTLRDTTKEVLYSMPMRPIALATRESYEEDTRLYRVMIDFKIRKQGEDNGCD